MVQFVFPVCKCGSLKDHSCSQTTDLIWIVFLGIGSIIVRMFHYIILEIKITMKINFTILYVAIWVNEHFHMHSISGPDSENLGTVLCIICKESQGDKKGLLTKHWVL